VDAKWALISDVEERGLTVEQAGANHGVKRTCAHKWLARYREFGLAGLEELSRAPYSRPLQSDAQKVKDLLELKAKHPDYGPAKLVAMLEEQAGCHFLAASTAGEILARHGMVKKRRPRRRGAGLIEHPPFTIPGPGHSMTTDYKGQFRMGNGRYCYPLTIVEPVSRYVFDIAARTSTATTLAKPVFEHVFRDYGVPMQIISDNGSPFSSSGSLGGLTELSKWWIDLGSTPVRIEPGQPQQNGRHERMHRTLKDRITASPQPNLRQQQQLFDRFREEFNHVRPHQSLGQKTPGSLLHPYSLQYPTKLRQAEYSALHTPRYVRSNGQIKWKGQFVFLTEVLIGEPVGLLQIDAALHEIYYRHVRIGYLDDRTMRASNAKPTQQPTVDDHLDTDEK
jgi:transposase InsO family protein